MTGSNQHAQHKIGLAAYSAILKTSVCWRPNRQRARPRLENINEFWGCLSTGVIDPDTQRLYQVCWVSPDKSGEPMTARYHMFVLTWRMAARSFPRF
jgi:hypothetical protein